jgi:hypothetical protein
MAIARFDAGPAADLMARDFVQLVSAALCEHPLAQLGLRHFLDDRTATLLLARSGSATLTLQAIDGRAMAALPAPSTVIFTPNQSHERVLSGSGAANIIRGTELPDCRMNLSRHGITLNPGLVLHRDGSREAMQFGAIPGCLLLLKLQRRMPGNQPAQEFDLTEGALVSQAAGNPRDSRIELAAALLGRMGRRDAAPFLAAIAEEQGGDSLRWQALRECLGLDSGTGFPSLCRIAADAADPLSAPAGALRAQLLEAWPQLSVIEPCPVS